MKTINYIKTKEKVMNTLNKKLGIFRKMRKYQNIATLILCAFAISGLVACAGGGGGGSTGGGDPVPVVTADILGLNDLSTYRLSDVDDDGELITEVSQVLANNINSDINKMRITIYSGDNSQNVASSDFFIIVDNWKTEAIDITSIASEGTNELTITITYFNGNNEIGTPTVRKITIVADVTAPSVQTPTNSSFLPITNKTSFTFNITFSENIAVNTFTAEDFITPTDLVTITTVNFNGSTNEATITATTDTEALSTATENLIISVGTNYEDEVGNTPTENQQIYDLDVVKPAVESVELLKDGNTDPSLYEIAYTFNEAVQPLATDNLDITGATIQTVDNVSSTQTIYSITITTTGDFVYFNLQNMRDVAGNVTATTAVVTREIGVLTLLKTTYVDADINQQGDIYNIFLQFSEAISADILSNEDITNSGNIKDHTIDIDANNKDATFYFELVSRNDTEKIDFTIDNLRTVDETDEYSLNFSIDFSPRVISIDGDLAGTYNIDLIGEDNSLSVTLKFSEAVTDLTIGDIFTDTVEGITPTLQFTDNTKEATLNIGIAAGIDKMFTLPRIADGVYQDTEGNTNIEDETYDYSPQYRIDTKRPSISNFTDIALPITDKPSFTFTLTFSEDINTNTFTVADDFTITPASFVSSTAIVFNGKNSATITATTDTEALSTADREPRLFL